LEAGFLAAVRTGNPAKIAIGKLHGVKLNAIAAVVTWPRHEPG
jgi:hypothetical protein